MTAPALPEWAVFDLVGTLLDPASLAPVLPERIADREGLTADALDEAALAAMALTHVGAHRPFRDLLGAAIVRRAAAAGTPLDASEVEEVLAAAAWMSPFPDAAACLDRLAAAGIRIAVLTNSPTAAAERALRTGRLLHRVSLVVGSDQVGAFKPDRRVYAHGLAALGARPAAAVMVAAHWWDLLGARAAGMRTAWVGHRERALTELLPAPDWRGDDLAAVAGAIASRPA